MGTLTVLATNGTTVAKGATYLVPLPSGKSLGNYQTAGAKITTSDGSVYPVTVSFGASGITVTNPTGRDIASGGFDFIDLQTSGILARFNAAGETAVLIGTKNTEAGLVSSTTDPLTGRIEKYAGSKTLPDEINLRKAYLPALIAGVCQSFSVPLATGCTTRPVYATYIDADNGSDAWDGSAPAFVSGVIGPKRTCMIASWTGTKTTWFTDEILLFRAGQTHIHTSTSTTLALASRKHLGAYRLPADAGKSRPILKTLLNTGAAAAQTRACLYASGTLTDISVSDIILDTSNVPNRHGINFFATAAGQSARNITLRNFDVINGTITDATAYAGVSFGYILSYATLSAFARSYNILVERCNAIDYPGHGFAFFGAMGNQLVNGKWSGIDVIACTAVGCGAGYDTHGFTSYSSGVLLDQTSGGWINVAAGPDVGTNAGSRVFYVSLNSRYGRDVPDTDIVHMNSGVGTEVFKLVKNTATPTTPNQGEFGYDQTGGTGNVRLYANFGATITATNQFSIAAGASRGIRYIGCLAQGQIWAARTAGTEGHGFAFDDFTSDCSIIDCVSVDNDGHGITINRGDNNAILSTEAHGNTLCPVKGNFGWGHVIDKCNFSGSGYSDTMPGYKGFLHLAHASHKAFGPNGTYMGPGQATNTIMSVVSNSTLEYTGTDPTVAVLLAPPNANSPFVSADNVVVNPGVGKFSDGRVVFIGQLDYLSNPSAQERVFVS